MESRVNDRYDELLMKILCVEQSIPDFLNIIFGFLYRRTDLFVEQTAVGQKFGYPTGQCEKLIHDSMSHFQSKARERNQLGEDMQMFDQVVENEEVVDMDETPSASNKQDCAIETLPLKIDFASNIKSPSNVENLSNVETSKFKAETSQSRNEQGAKTQTPLFIRKESQAASSNCYNGADRGLYAWSQTISDIEVEVPLSPSIVKSSQISVTVTTSNINVRVDGTELFSGMFPRPVKQDETVWTLTPGKSIQIHLEKAKECWWDRLVQSEPKISLQQIDATRPFSELSQEEQMKLNEVVWNDYQKSQGLPTSQQMKSADVLKRAWEAEGSPFKGRPFDPSIISDQ